MKTRQTIFGAFLLLSFAAVVTGCVTVPTGRVATGTTNYNFVLFQTGQVEKGVSN